jgi:hypothetical protein
MRAGVCRQAVVDRADKLTRIRRSKHGSQRGLRPQPDDPARRLRRLKPCLPGSFSSCPAPSSPSGAEVNSPRREPGGLRPARLKPRRGGSAMMWHARLPPLRGLLQSGGGPRASRPWLLTSAPSRLPDDRPWRMGLTSAALDLRPFRTVGPRRGSLRRCPARGLHDPGIQYCPGDSARTGGNRTVSGTGQRRTRGGAAPPSSSL